MAAAGARGDGTIVKFTLRTKLMLAFTTMLALTLIVGGLGVVEAKRINDRVAEMYSDDLVGTGQVATLSQDVQAIRARVLAHILATDPARKADLEAEIARRDQATDAAVMTTEQGTKGTDRGQQLIARAGGAIDDLAGAIEETAHSAAQIAGAARQHAAGMGQIAAAMHEINQATTQNLAATNDTEQAAGGLARLAGSLTTLVARYQL